MSATDAFFDTNIAVYLVSPDEVKSARAEALVRQGGVVSVQVLTEFATVMRHKFGASWPRIRELLTALRTNLSVTPVVAETHELGLLIAERYHFRVYDSQLLAAALLAGCTTFWSEDLHDGQVIENTLTIRSPFS